jgi:putative SOS response-associated peptidase YedK
MCRRFWLPQLQPDFETYFKNTFGFDLNIPSEIDRRSKGFTPFNDVPVFFNDGNQVTVRSMYWCLVPASAPEFKPNRTWFNTRADSFKKGYQANLLKYNRCLILASRFFEKRWEFKLKNNELMFLGGVYDIWGGSRYSCSIITVPANEVVGRVHDRMPHIVEHDRVSSWLNPEKTDLFYPSFEPYRSDRMVGRREDNQIEMEL